MNMTQLLTLIFIVMILTVLVLVIVLSRKLPLGSTRFGDYILQEMIGKGGMASIYYAKNRILKRTVAVKILDQALMRDRDLVYKFLKEGENLAKINSEFPGSPVVKVLEYSHSSSDWPYFISMEYLKGATLWRLLESKKIFPLKAKLYIIKEIARALHCSHALKIYHRDVSPDNIFISGNTVTLIDFGIAKQEFSDYRTLDGRIAGKPYYMSPEQGAGKVVSDKSDIYSLGVVLYYMLEGNHPFKSSNHIELMKMHQTCPVPDIKHPIQPGLRNLLYQMLSKEPDARPDALDVVNKLDYLMQQKV
jgi:serine/threonine-protein kinase